MITWLWSHFAVQPSAHHTQGRESIVTTANHATPSMLTQATALAARTADAYSAKRYASWVACATALLGRGYTAQQSQEILRSKITRWAADASSQRYGRATANDLMRFMDRHPSDVRAVGAGL